MRFPAHFGIPTVVSLALALAPVAVAKEPSAPDPVGAPVPPAPQVMSEGARLVEAYRVALAAGLAAGMHGQAKARPAGPAEARLLEAAKLAAEIATLEAQRQAAGIEPGRGEELALSRERLQRLLRELDVTAQPAGGAR